MGIKPFERMRTHSRRMSVTLGFCLLALPIFADFYPQVTLDPTVSKFLGEGLEFSASVERMVVLDSAGRTNATFIFKSVELKKPAKELFEPPNGFTRCDMQSMLERIREKWPKDK